MKESASTFHYFHGTPQGGPMYPGSYVAGEDGYATSLINMVLSGLEADEAIERLLMNGPESTGEPNAADSASCARATDLVYPQVNQGEV